MVVLAALKDLDESAEAKAASLPWYMRDCSMGLFPPGCQPRRLAELISESVWYRWISMGVIAASIVAVIWTPNSSEAGPDTHVS